jgi:hypothetical protein
MSEIEKKITKEVIVHATETKDSTC